MSNSGMDKRKALGKGLSALLPERAPTPSPSASNGPNRINPDLIDPNPVQPRSVFEPARLEELAQSIRANGVIQPLIVRRSGNRYELVAGERRLRASKLAGLREVPVIVQELATERLLEVALIENIQREDLNPIETAQAYERLHREYQMSHEQIGERTGKDRSSVANLIRLLKLPLEVQRLVSEGRLSMGQARALLSLPEAKDQVQLAEKAVSQGLSTRQVEAYVRQMLDAQTNRQPGTTGRSKTERPMDPNLKAAIDQLERHLGTRVRIVEQTDQRGRIEIDYFSQEELTRLYELIVGA
jgi:ParB family chromosome partitioning protein